MFGAAGTGTSVSRCVTEFPALAAVDSIALAAELFAGAVADFSDPDFVTASVAGSAASVVVGLGPHDLAQQAHIGQLSGQFAQPRPKTKQVAKMCGRNGFIRISLLVPRNIQGAARPPRRAIVERRDST